ncbi:PTS glucose transporter subunit IIA [Bacillus sp. FSL W7-1360]
MFKKWFKKEETIVSPLNGAAVAIESVPDPTFAEKMVGDGLAVEPTDGRVVAPVAGKVVQIFPTNHAFGIETAIGAEILIHIGLETVGMKGEGFTARVKEGDTVKPGDVIIEFDLSLVKEKAAHTVTPIVVTNVDQFAIEKQPIGDVVAGETPLFTLIPR